MAVSPEGRVTPETPTIDEWAAPTAGSSSCSSGMQVGGSCRSWSEGVDLPLGDGWPLVSASALRYGPFSAVPTALDASEMAAVCESFVRATRRADELDVAVLELDLAHGYLLEASSRR